MPYSFDVKNLIIFDFDGVIADLKVDWKKLKAELSRRAFEIYGQKMEFQPLSKNLNEIYERFGDMGRHELFEIIRKHEMPKGEVSYSINSDMVYLIKSIKWVRKDIKFAILSNNSRCTVEYVLKEEKISDLFDKIVCLCDVNRCKPDVEGIEKILKSLKVKKENALYIGDKEIDRMTAKNAGVDFDLKVAYV